MDFLSPSFPDDEAGPQVLEAFVADGPYARTVASWHATRRSAPRLSLRRKGMPQGLTVTMKTVMERSHIALHKWLQGSI